MPVSLSCHNIIINLSDTGRTKVPVLCTNFWNCHRKIVDFLAVKFWKKFLSSGECYFLLGAAWLYSPGGIISRSLFSWKIYSSQLHCSVLCGCKSCWLTCWTVAALLHVNTSTLLKYLICNVLCGELSHSSWHNSQKQQILGYWEFKKPLVPGGITVWTSLVCSLSWHWDSSNRTGI